MDIGKFLDALSEILSEKYDADVRVTITKEDNVWERNMSDCSGESRH